MVFEQQELMHKNINAMIANGAMKQRHLVIFGCNEPAECLMDYLNQNGIIIDAIIDNNQTVQGKKCRGIKIQSPREALGEKYLENAMIFIISKYYNEMCIQLKQMDYEEGKNIIKVLEMNIGSQFETSIEVFNKKLERVKRGLFYLKEIKKEYGEETQVFILPHQALGDTYIVGKYFEDFRKKEEIHDYIFIFASKTCAKVIHLFGIDCVKIMEKEEVDDITQASIFIGLEKSRARILHNSYVYSNKIDNLSNYKSITFADEYKYGVFGLDSCNQGVLPIYTKDSTYVEKLFKDNGLIKGKTIILSPYANSLVKLPDSFWEKLVFIMNEKGYELCTNCSNENELPIKGTKAIFFPINEAIAAVEYAGYFIGLRSGICDIISTAAAKKIILYPDKVYRYDTMQNFFGLKNMELCNEVSEYTYKEEEETEILQKIVLEWRKS